MTADTPAPETPMCKPGQRFYGDKPPLPPPVTLDKQGPLWRVMAGAWSARVIVGRLDAERLAIAAEIRALRDWLVPFEEVQGPYANGPLGWVISTEEQHRCDERQRLRALLTAEAERAEKGK
jgi:hypothetical protein